MANANEELGFGVAIVFVLISLAGGGSDQDRQDRDLASQITTVKTEFFLEPEQNRMTWDDVALAREEAEQALDEIETELSESKQIAGAGQVVLTDNATSFH